MSHRNSAEHRGYVSLAHARRARPQGRQGRLQVAAERRDQEPVQAPRDASLATCRRVTLAHAAREGRPTIGLCVMRSSPWLNCARFPRPGTRHHRKLPDARGCWPRSLLRRPMMRPEPLFSCSARTTSLGWPGPWSTSSRPHLAGHFGTACPAKVSGAGSWSGVSRSGVSRSDPLTTSPIRSVNGTAGDIGRTHCDQVVTRPPSPVLGAARPLTSVRWLLSTSAPPSGVRPRMRS